MAPGHTPESIARRGHRECLRRVVIPPNPAAGAEWIVNVPGGTLWRLLAARVTLVTSATIATRRTRIAYDDGSAVFYSRFSETDITNGSTTVVTFARLSGNHLVALPGEEHLQISSPLLEPGYRIRSISQALQAGDQYGPIVLYVEETTVSHESLDAIRQVWIDAGLWPEPGQ